MSLSLCCWEPSLTGSAFPNLSKILEVPEGLDVLYINDRRKYECIEDWFLCIMFPDFRNDCMKFYKNDGPSLRDSYSHKEIKILERELISSLSVILK